MRNGRGNPLVAFESWSSIASIDWLRSLNSNQRFGLYRYGRGTDTSNGVLLLCFQMLLALDVLLTEFAWRSFRKSFRNWKKCEHVLGAALGYMAGCYSSLSLFPIGETPPFLASWNPRCLIMDFAPRSRTKPDSGERLDRARQPQVQRELCG